MQLICEADQLAKLLSGKLMSASLDLHGLISSDSRSINHGDVFVALRGDVFDGHDFLADVQAKGASLAVVEQFNEALSLPQIVVENSLRAFGQMGKLIRDYFVGPVFAITGSCGKTTSKEMLACILATEGRVVATKGNHNNEVGVPQTLSQLENSYDFAIIEMGAAKLNDIAYLADFVEPDYAMVTMVAPSHLQSFGSLQNIAATKYEIFSNTHNLRGCVINGDDPVTEAWRAPLLNQELRVYSFGMQSKNDVFAADVNLGMDHSVFTVYAPQGQFRVTLNVPGKHMVMNALAVISLALMSGVEANNIIKGLAQYRCMAGRLAESKRWGMRIIDDTYNANPTSMKSAIETLSMSVPRRILVLGDMAELGEQSEAMHSEVGRYAMGRVDALFCCGEKMKATAAAFGADAHYFEDQESLALSLSEYSQTGDTLLFKGSRSSKMEKVIARLAQLKEGE